MISSPYNFVPLNHDVFIPDWNDKVSHDIPFSDGESGIIHLKIKNLTAMHISGGKDSNGISLPCHIMKNSKRQYFIPATTIKGMICSVAEVLSFAKLAKYNDDYFGYRYFGKSKTGIGGEYKNEMKDALTGYLLKKDDKYYVYPCKSEQILIKDIKLRDYESEGKILVKSGDIEKKRHEHLFNEFDASITPVEVPEEVIKVFFSIYKPNRNFEKIRKRIQKGVEIPVFYHMNKGKVKHLGLSRNYRLPYKHRVSDGIYQICKDVNGRQLQSGRDMIETLFGYTEKNSSLKGRVQIGHAFCNEMVTDDSLVLVQGVLGQPQASFTPLYLKQDATRNEYVSYSDEHIEIAGRKRYRIHSDEYITSLPKGNGNDKVSTSLYLLPSGNTFNLSIAVHNIKPCELGLLLSAITLHNNNQAFHNLGMAKSYGYGKMSIEEIKLDGFSCDDIEYYLKKFEFELCKFTIATQGLDWSKTVQVSSLISISSNHSQGLELMDMKEYQKHKSNMEYSPMPIETVAKVNAYFTRADIIAEQERIEAAKRQAEDEAWNRKRMELEAEIKAQKDAENAAIIENRNNRISLGLMCLEEKYEFGPNAGKYKVVKIKLLKDKIERWLRDSGESSIPDDQLEILVRTLKRIYDEMSTKEKKSMQDSSKGIWVDVTRWTSPDIALNVFASVVN